LFTNANKIVINICAKVYLDLLTSSKIFSFTRLSYYSNNAKYGYVLWNCSEWILNNWNYSVLSKKTW